MKANDSNLLILKAMRDRLKHLEKRIAFIQALPRLSCYAKAFNSGSINARQAESYFLEELLEEFEYHVIVRPGVKICKTY